MLVHNPRLLHNHMIEHFDDATEGNRVLISETKIREFLKTSCSHIKKMSAREKIMCGCKNCILFDDMHECLNLYWKRYIKRMKRDLEGMRDGRSKNYLSAKLATYINQVCSDPNDIQHNPKYKSGWDAASALGCPPMTIDDRQYCRFACALENVLNAIITGKV